MKNIMLLAGIYIIVILVLYLDQRSLQYYPHRVESHAPADYGLSGVEVIKTETSDGLTLRHWFSPPQNENDPIVVYFHGNAGHIGFQAVKTAYFINAGFGVLAAEYRGYGDNPGELSEVGLYRDAASVMEWLAAEGYDGKNQIFLYGESLGSGVATEMATRFDIAGLILEAPFTSATDIAQSLYPYVPVGYLLKDRYENISKIDRIGAPLLIVHGTEDRTIPMKWGRQLFDAARKPKNLVLIKQAHHNNAFDYGAFEPMRDFITRYALPSASPPSSRLEGVF